MARVIASRKHFINTNKVNTRRPFKQLSSRERQNQDHNLRVQQRRAAVQAKKGEEEEGGEESAAATKSRKARNSIHDAPNGQLSPLQALNVQLANINMNSR
jgi:hypothetical protein